MLLESVDKSQPDIRRLRRKCERILHCLLQALCLSLFVSLLLRVLLCYPIRYGAHGFYCKGRAPYCFTKSFTIVGKNGLKVSKRLSFVFNHLVKNSGAD
jgi:hypothetical protein